MALRPRLRPQLSCGDQIGEQGQADAGPLDAHQFVKQGKPVEAHSSAGKEITAFDGAVSDAQAATLPVAEVNLIIEDELACLMLDRWWWRSRRLRSDHVANLSQHLNSRRQKYLSLSIRSVSSRARSAAFSAFRFRFIPGMWRETRNGGRVAVS
jgi:hypothetical protein